jgi:hypothetical protein
VNNFSVIIPTLGRDTLPKAIRSFIGELQAGDEVIVVADGHQSWLRSRSLLYGSFGKEVLEGHFRLITTDPTRDGGASQRNYGISKAKGSWLLFIDDDDIYLPNGISMIRDQVSHGELQPYMFRMQHGRSVIWAEEIVRHKNVSTSMFVTPNVKGRIGKWEGMGDTGRSSDYVFIRSTLDKWPAKEGDLVWSDTVVARLFRHSNWKEPTGEVCASP